MIDLSPEIIGSPTREKPWGYLLYNVHGKLEGVKFGWSTKEEAERWAESVPMQGRTAIVLKALTVIPSHLHTEKQDLSE